MQVKDWMTPNPTTIASNTPLMEAVGLLKEKGFRRLPVVNNGDLLGIVTDRDLKEASPSDANSLSIYELNYLLSKLTVKEIMKRPVLTIGQNEPIEQAAILMQEHKISGLPVVEAGKVVGMLTISDILNAFIDILKLREGKALSDQLVVN